MTNAGEGMGLASCSRQWPAEGLTRVPYWVYSDAELYAEEQRRIFAGPAWSYLCLEAELPRANTYRRTNLGAMPVVVTMSSAICPCWMPDFGGHNGRGTGLFQGRVASGEW